MTDVRIALVDMATALVLAAPPMPPMLEWLNSIAGLAAMGVAALLAWVNNRLRAELAEFKITVMNRDKAIMQELSSVFLRKPELTEDYPVSRREFFSHRDEDRELHRTLNSLLERFHERFRANEDTMADYQVKLTQLEVEKVSRDELKGSKGRM